MARDSRSILEELEQLEATLEDDISGGFRNDGQPGSGTVRYLVADHHAARTIHELKDMMRATADLLEMEAARLRHEIEVLELEADHATLH
jgi:hypothetical protein